MTTYFLQANGTAPNKEAAVGTPSDPSTFMAVAVHNGQAFSEGDEVRVCSEGGTYHASLGPPSSGVVYQGDGDTRPVISGDDTRNSAIEFRDKSNVTFRDLIVERAKFQAIFAGANAADISGLQFINIEARYSDSGIMLFTEIPDKTVTDVLFDGVVARHNRGTGVSCALHGGGNILYRDCLAFANAVNAPDDPMYQFTAGLYAISLDKTNRLTNVVWDTCAAIGNGIGAARSEAGYGIWFDTAGPNAEIRDSVTIANNKAGAYLENTDVSPGVKMHDIITSRNGVGVKLYRGSHGVEIYGITGFENQVGMQILGQWGGGDPVGMVGNVIRDNMILNSTERALMAAYGGETGNTYQDNVFNPEAPGFIEYGKDVLYDTIADWEAAVGTVEGNRT